MFYNQGHPHYTRKTDFRHLDRNVATICRKLARLCWPDKVASCPLWVDERMVARFWGPSKYSCGMMEAGTRVGVTSRLVRRELGGSHFDRSGAPLIII